MALWHARKLHPEPPLAWQGHTPDGDQKRKERRAWPMCGEGRARVPDYRNPARYAKMLQKPPCENAAKAPVLVGRRNSRKQLNGTVHYPSWGGGHVRQARGLGAYDTYAQKGACGGLAILFRRALWPKIPLKSPNLHVFLFFNKNLKVRQKPSC